MPDVRNIFSELPAGAGTEHFRTLLESGGVKIERIVSCAAASPPGFWYDQDHDEWVMVLRGEAVLEFEKDPLVTMGAGDHLLIPRHVKHRVQRTSGQTVWLTVHLAPE